MPEDKDAVANYLVPAGSHSLARYSSEIASRGLDLAQRLLASKPIRLLVLHNLPSTREIIPKMLLFQDRIQIVGYAENAAEMIEEFEMLLADVIMIELHLPAIGGIAATAEICGRHPGANVIFATILEPMEYASAARSAGAKAYLQVPYSGEQLISAIHEVAKGRVHPSILVYDPKSLKEYYAGSGVAIEALIGILERLNQTVADEAEKADLTPLKHDMGPTASEKSPDEIAQVLQIRLDPFLRVDLESQIENIWHVEIEQYLDELKSYFGEQKWFDDFGWDKVKARILRYPSAKSS